MAPTYLRYTFAQVTTDTFTGSEQKEAALNLVRPGARCTLYSLLGLCSSTTSTETAAREFMPSRESTIIACGDRDSHPSFQAPPEFGLPLPHQPS
ncbi:hypothetical protein Cob_v005603 [Colletotrichum orbiculare MAFF 240422]|uniref:Uncharacterized protein n=1 Tax=Colletotrichum orbiculare (strain 104-T / ATCC 96160 / CBS 514.97 / LARS 414 / MAFF 240422) TaxID=1213857 RepID=A0A484FST1_COLOR|nr:hypothetical protein Cob_v005603 [Colletotrichum orbiculare MAFF 240422]